MGYGIFAGRDRCSTKLDRYHGFGVSLVANINGFIHYMPQSAAPRGEDYMTVILQVIPCSASSPCCLVCIALRSTSPDMVSHRILLDEDEVAQGLKTSVAQCPGEPRSVLPCPHVQAIPNTLPSSVMRRTMLSGSVATRIGKCS